MFLPIIIIAEDCYNVKTIRLNFDRVVTSPNYYIPYKVLKKPTIGLALSGGGARGLAQIGVLQAFEENNIDINFIVGVSMGAIIGGLYASGYNPDQLQQIMSQMDWNKYIFDTPLRTSLFLCQKEELDRSIIQIQFQDFKPFIPQGFTAGQNLSMMLNELTMRSAYQSSSNYDNLKIPFRALACDLVSGDKVLIKKGNLAEALKASASFPLLFSPVQKDSMLLADGGLINNLPVDEVRENGIDIVIAVNTISKLHDRKVLLHPWKIADQVTSIMQREKIKEQIKKTDILVQLDMKDRTSDNFEKLDTLINYGRNKADEQVHNIIDLINKKKRIGFNNFKHKISNLKILCYSDSIKKTIISKYNYQKAKQLSEYEIYSIIEEIYETGSFLDVYAEINSDNQLLVHTVENLSFSKIIIKGNTVFPDSTIINQIASLPKAPINYHQSKIDLEKICEIYRKNAYSLARINHVELSHNILNIEINEGLISDIIIKGNSRTKDYVVLREFPLKKNDIFNINKAIEGVDNIHSAGFFTNVYFEIERENNKIKVIINVIEKPFTIIGFGLRFDLIKRGKGFIEFADKNVLGTGSNLSFTSLYGIKDQSLKLSLRTDRIFETYFTSKIDVYYNLNTNYTYSNGKRIGEYINANNGISISLGQQLQRFGNLSFIGRINSIDVKAVEGSGYVSEKIEMKTIALQSIIDTQDRYPFPIKGKYYNFFYEFSSGTLLNSQVSYLKIFSSLETYFTLRKRNTIHPKILWGTSDLTTPFSEQFRLGGLNSFYGLYKDELIGRHVLLTSLEYRYFFPFRIAFDVYLSIRFDAGATWKNANDFHSRDIKQGLGIALSLNTYVGPITLAYGRHSEKRNRFYFSAGYEF